MTESTTQAFHLVDTLEALIKKTVKQDAPANRIRQRPDSQQNMRKRATAFLNSLAKPTKDVVQEKEKTVGTGNITKRLEELAKKMLLTFITPKNNEGLLKGKVGLEPAYMNADIDGKLGVTKEMMAALEENGSVTESLYERREEPKGKEQVIPKKETKKTEQKSGQQNTSNVPKTKIEKPVTKEEPSRKEGEKMDEQNVIQETPVAGVPVVDMAEIKTVVKENKKLAGQIVETRAQKDANAKELAKTEATIQANTSDVTRLEQSIADTTARLEEAMKQLKLSMSVLQNTQQKLDEEIAQQRQQLEAQREIVRKTEQQKAERQADLSRLAAKLSSVTEANQTVSELISQATSQRSQVAQQPVQQDANTYVAFDPRAVAAMQGMAYQKQVAQQPVQQIPDTETTVRVR